MAEGWPCERRFFRPAQPSTLRRSRVLSVRSWKWIYPELEVDEWEGGREGGMEGGRDRWREGTMTKGMDEQGEGGRGAQPRRPGTIMPTVAATPITAIAPAFLKDGWW